MRPGERSMGWPGSWSGDPEATWAERIGVPLLELHPTLSSTSDRLREVAAAGAPSFAMVVAGRQTAGRGRVGRTWHSADGGGLWASLLLRDRAPSLSGVLPLAVGVAVARALERWLPGAIGLKWPNDVMVGDRKVAGILCEAVGEPDEGVVVGMGVNLRPPADGLPAELAGAVAFVESEAGVPVPDPEVARGIVRELGRWAQPVPRRLEGRLRDEWESRDVLRGCAVILEGGSTGVAVGVEPDGALRVTDPTHGTRAIRSGGVRRLSGGPGGPGEGGTSAGPGGGVVQISPTLPERFREGGG